MENLTNNTQHKAKFNKLYREIATYIIVMLFLCFVNYLSSPSYWWVIWPAAGWGLAIVLQAIRIFFPSNDNDD